ncbi:unnamed protein product [Phytomonas sp. EM1]|nr:unnamed protein product [Phytomonas sp. EM1]|eukprot:CCW64156.1 unnamed protein product [Phytomonas sp. isolate EM1]
MYPSLNPHTTVGSDSIRNTPSLSMNSIHLNAYPGVSGERATELYTSQPLQQPSSNAFRGDFFYSGSTPQASSSHHLSSAAVPFSSAFNIPLQVINNANRDFTDDYASRCAYTHGIIPHSYREGYTTALHAYSGNPTSQPMHRKSTSGAPAMTEYSRDHVALARLSSASSLSTRASAPGENGARPIVIPEMALPYYRSPTEYYSPHPSSRNSRMEDGVCVASDNVMIPPPCLKDSSYHDHQFVGARVGTSAHPTAASTSTQTPPLAVMPNTTFTWRSLPCDPTAPSISGPYTHGINPVASAGIDEAALHQSSSLLAQSLRLASTDEHPMIQRNHDNDSRKDLGHMNLLLNERGSCEPQVMLGNTKQYPEAYITQESELAEDESVFARVSAIERTLMELLAWGRTALSSPCLSFPSPSGCTGDCNVDTGRDVGVIIQTQAGQVEMDLQICSYLLECLECVEEQLLPLEEILHKFLHKYIIADGNSVLTNHTAPISSPLGPPKAASPQLVTSERQEKNDVSTTSGDIECVADSPLDPTITPVSTIEAHLTGATSLNSAPCIPKELSSRCEHIRQLLLDDILLGQLTTRSSYGVLNLSNDVGRLSHNSCMSFGGAGLSTVDSFHTSHGVSGDQPPHEFPPLRLIMIPAECNDNGRHSIVSKASNRVTALGPIGWEAKAQESNADLPIAERLSGSGGRDTASSTVTLLASSSCRGSEQLIAVVATPVRYAQYQLFLTISMAVDYLNHALHLGQLRNEKELQKTCERTQLSPTVAIINTVPNEALLPARINLQKDAEVFRMWTNRVGTLQDRLRRIKGNIDAAVRGHASVRRQVLEILNQRLNNEERVQNGDDDSTHRCCDNGTPVGPHERESELNSPGGSTVAFRETSSLSQHESMSFANSNAVDATTVAEATRISSEEGPLSHSMASGETFRLHNLPSTSGAHQPVLDTISSERRPQQLHQGDNDVSHEFLLQMGDEKEGQPTCNTNGNGLEHCANKFFYDQASNVEPDGGGPRENTRNAVETEIVASSGLLEGSGNKTDPSNDPVGIEELFNSYNSGRKHSSWSETTCQVEGVTPTHQTLVSLPHDTDHAACSNPADLVALDRRDSSEGGEECKPDKVFHQCHTHLNYHICEDRRISSLKNSDDYKWCARKTSRGAFLSLAEPRARASSVCPNDSSDDDGPIEYSFRSPNNLFRGFKAFLKAVVRRATSFDSDDDELNENSRKRRRRG